MTQNVLTLLKYGVPRDIVKVTPGDDPLAEPAIGLMTPTAGRVVVKTSGGVNRAIDMRNGQQVNVGVTHVFSSAEVDGSNTTTTAATVYALIP